MSELDKLEQYLKGKGIDYKRIDESGEYGTHQIIVFDAKENREWDAICNKGSYGFDEGLLEIYGKLVNPEKDDDSVVGWLTAEDVIRRIEGHT